MSIRVKQKGFTMLELLAVMMVLSVVALLAANDRAREGHRQLVDARGERAIRVIEAAKTFRERVGDWPLSVHNLVSSGDLLEDERMPNYASEFSLHDIGGNRITVHYNVGDDRIARRLAGTLPYGARHSEGVVRYQIDRPGFESSLAAITERFYDLDGSRALQGNMNANNYDIQNVDNLDANNVSATRVQTNQIRTTDGAGGLDIQSNRLTARSEFEVRGNVFADSLRGRPTDGSTVGIIRPNGTSDFRGRVNIHGLFNTHGDTTSTSIQNRLRGRTQIDGELHASENINSPMYRLSGSVSVGSSCEFNGSLKQTGTNQLVQCRGKKWVLVGGETSVKSIARLYMSRLGSISSGTVGGTTPQLARGTYKLDLILHCHNSSGVWAYEFAPVIGTNHWTTVARGSGSGYYTQTFSVYFPEPITTARTATVQARISTGTCNGADQSQLLLVTAHRIEAE